MSDDMFQGGKLKGLVLLSLAVNLFLIGVVAAPFFGRGSAFVGPPPMPPPGPEHMIGHLTRDLPPEDAARARAIFEEGKEAFPQRHEAERKAFRQIASIMKQEKPDLQELQRALEDIKDSGQVLHDNMSRIMQRLAMELPLESRRKIAEAMERGPMGGPGPMGPPDQEGMRPMGAGPEGGQMPMDGARPPMGERPTERP